MIKSPVAEDGKEIQKILIVDDLEPFLNEEKSFLNRAEFQLFTTNSSREALEIHRREHVSLILADLNLPDMPGDELARIIRTEPELKMVSIIIISSQKRVDIDRCATSGANDIITRPIDQKRLLDKVSRLLDIPRRKSIRVLIKAKVMGYFGQNDFYGLTHNISTHGLLLETEKVLAKGDVISCSFFIPDTERVQVEGVVVRSAKMERMFQYGLEFRELSSREKEYIQAFVEKQKADQAKRNKQ